MGIFDSIKRKLGVDIKNNNGVNEEYLEKKLKKQYFKKSGKLHGEYYEYNWDGWVEEQSVYAEGKKHGITKYFHKKHISAEGAFNNGQETGVIKKYFLYEKLKNTELHPVIEEIADLDKGIYKVFSLDGKILERSEIDGVKFTRGSSWYGCSGAIDPIRSGLSEKWFENGKLKEKGLWEKNYTTSIYNLSHRKGEHVHYHNNGNIFKKGNWINKVPAGTHKVFYPSGNIEFEVDYGTPNGNRYDEDFPEKESIIKERWYNENGSLMSSDEIIKKGGIDPRKITLPGMKVNYAPSQFEVHFASINDLNFKRMGIVKFYDSYSNYSLGHSYELV